MCEDLERPKGIYCFLGALDNCAALLGVSAFLHFGLRLKQETDIDLGVSRYTPLGNDMICGLTHVECSEVVYV